MCYTAPPQFDIPVKRISINFVKQTVIRKITYFINQSHDYMVSNKHYITCTQLIKTKPNQPIVNKLTKLDILANKAADKPTKQQ